MDGVRKAITQKVEPQHRQADGDTGGRSQPGGDQKKLSTGFQHIAPGRSRWACTQSEEGQGRFRHYDPADTEIAEFTRHCERDERAKTLHLPEKPFDVAAIYPRTVLAISPGLTTRLNAWVFSGGRFDSSPLRHVASTNCGIAEYYEQTIEHLQATRKRVGERPACGSLSDAYLFVTLDSSHPDSE
jgi:hypothetical protein